MQVETGGIEEASCEIASSPAKIGATKTEKQKQKEEERAVRERQKEEEKAARERAREVERQQKEERRLQREAEKRNRDAEKEKVKRENEAKREQQRKEKEEKERLKQEERQKKEDEKRKKEEEKRKAEEEKKEAEMEKIRKAEKLKISNFFKPKTVVKSSAFKPLEVESQSSDYEKTFHDFYLKNGAELCTSNRLDKDQLIESIKIFDEGLEQKSPAQHLFITNSNKSYSYQYESSAKYIYSNQLDGAPLGFKFLKFYENIKTYDGSFTKPISDELALEPFKTNEYSHFIDWNNEADEDEEGEGEDLGDDDDEEEEEEEDEDMDDFLEEDTANNLKRKNIGPLVPQITWKDPQDDIYKIEVLKANISMPIDPLENYWSSQTSTPTKNKPEVDNLGKKTDDTRFKKAKTFITDKSDLETFAQQVNESDYTLSTMVEILKKQLPSYTKMTIENTLRNLAKKVGRKAAERKWEVDRELLNKLIE